MSANSELDQLFLDRLNKAINQVATLFKKHPLDFLYESDIQVALYSALYENFEYLRFNPNAQRLKDFKLPIGQSDGRINPVKTEYPSGKRFDIAILDPNDSDINKKIWAQPCKVGIEIKFWQVDGTGGQVKGDVQKLLDYQQMREKQNRPFLGISLLFLQPGTPEKRLKGYEPLANNTDFPSNGLSVQIIGINNDGLWRRNASEWLAQQTRRDKTD